MKKHIYILAFTLSILSLQSCVDSIPIPVQEVDAKIRFESKIGTDKGFAAVISTSSGISDISEISYPRDLDVSISWGIDATFNLYYNEDCNCYLDTSPTPYKVEPGINYELDINVDSDIYEDVNAYMKVPPTPKTDLLQSVIEIHDDGTTSLKSKIAISDNNSGNFYHIIPFRKETVLEEFDGALEEVYTGLIEPLTLIDFDNDNIALEQLYKQPGFLVNFSDENVSTNPLNLLLHTDTVIDYDNEAFTKVFFQVRSVTESYYHYEKYLSRKLASHEKGELSAEVISYTNIINGLGYFGGYNTMTDSTLVQ